jgi:acyl carrier protein
MSIEERVYNIIKKKTKKEFDGDSWLVSIMDSLSRYELLYEIEEEFNVTVDESSPDVQGWETVNDIIKFLNE